VTWRLLLASSVEAPRRLSPRTWTVAISLLVLAVAILGCSPSPETKETAHPVCAWGRDLACCIQPPTLGVAWLRDLRAQRWGR
jgi:hypothetical protein